MDKLANKLNVTYTEKDSLLLNNVVLGMHAYLGISEMNRSIDLNQDGRRKIKAQEDMDEKCEGDQRDENETLCNNLMLNNSYLLCILASMVEEKRRNNIRIEFDNTESEVDVKEDVVTNKQEESSNTETGDVKTETERKNVKQESDKDKIIHCKGHQMTNLQMQLDLSIDDEDMYAEHEKDETEMIFDNLMKIDGFIVYHINNNPWGWDNSWYIQLLENKRSWTKEYHKDKWVDPEYPDYRNWVKAFTVKAIGDDDIIRDFFRKMGRIEYWESIKKELINSYNF